MPGHPMPGHGWPDFLLIVAFNKFFLKFVAIKLTDTPDKGHLDPDALTVGGQIRLLFS